MAEIEASQSIVEVIDFGLQLATLLQSFVEVCRKAKHGLLEVVSDVNSTVSALKQLQDFLDADDKAQNVLEKQVFTSEGRREIKTMTAQCARLYTTLVVLLRKAGSSTEKGKGKGKEKVTFSSVGSKMLNVSNLNPDIMNWDWLEQRIHRCQEQLGWLKISLLLMLRLASLARFQLGATQRIPGSFDEELGIRAMAELLRRQKVKSIKPLVNRQHQSEQASRLSRASSVIIIPENPRIIGLQEDGTDVPLGSITGEQITLQRPKFPIHFEGLTTNTFQDSRPIVLKDENNDYLKTQSYQNTDHKSESSVTLNNFDGDLNDGLNSKLDVIPEKDPLPTECPPTKPETKLNGSNDITANLKTPETIAKLDKAQVLTTLPVSVFGSRFSSLTNRIFGQRDNILEDQESDELEAYVILKGSNTFKIPFGHQRLMAGLKALKKKRNASFWAPFLALNPRFHESILDKLNESTRADGRDRTCLAFEVFTDKTKSNKPTQQLIVFFSLGRPAEPVMLEDCISGRKMVFPFHLCATWHDMHELVTEAFKDMDIIGAHVEAGHYDICGPDGDCLLPQTWSNTIKPGWKIKLHLWPMTRQAYHFGSDCELNDSGWPMPGRVLKRNPPASTTLRRGIESFQAKMMAELEQKKSTNIRILRFKDAVGRFFRFPFESCKTWPGIESLVKQAFAHVEVIGPHVDEGHYDLIGPTGDIIMPSVWSKMVQPGWLVTMHMWPMSPPPMIHIGPSPPKDGNIDPPIRPLGPPFPPCPAPSQVPRPTPPGWIPALPLPRPAPFTPYIHVKDPLNKDNKRRRASPSLSYSSFNTFNSTASLIQDENIEDEPEDLGIKVDWEKEKKECEVSLGELLARWTNAIDTETMSFLGEDSDSDGSSSYCSSLSDD